MDNYKHDLRPEKLNFLLETLKIVDEEKPQSVLLTAIEGAGKTTLIKQLIKEIPEQFSILFHFNPKNREDNPYDFLYQIFYYLWNSKNEVLQKVKQYFIQHTQGEINVLDKNANEIFNNANYQYYYKIVLDILKDFIFICSQHKKIVIIFENLHLYTEESRKWLFQLVQGINHPIFTIFSTDDRNILSAMPPVVQHLNLPPLNVKSVEKLIQFSLNSGEINAKFITNFVHIKSDGNPSYIINMIDEIFKDKALYIDNVLDVNKINPKELPASWQDFWLYKWKSLKNCEELEKVFYYIFMFPHEKDFKFWKRFFSKLNLLDEFNTLIKNNWLCVVKNLEIKLVYPYHSSLLTFIKTQINREKILEYIASHKSKSITDKVITQLSYNSLLLSAFSLNTYQLSKIHTEINKLIAYGRYQQAINILNTVVLSPDFEEFSRQNRLKILKLLAELFEYQGNYENALLYYHRLRDLTLPAKNEFYLEINYNIGKNLFKIDKIEEAHILLKKIVEKDSPPPVLKAKIYSVYALIHYTNLQYTQAVNFFKKSLTILEEEEVSKDIEIIKADIFHQLVKVYRMLGDFDQAINMLNEAQEIYVKYNEISNKLKVILHKSYIWYKNLEPLAALKNIMKDYFKIRHLYAPGIMEILQKQIAELYWLVGKWRFARQYYNKLYEFFSWRGDIYNAGFMLGNMAIISKEIGAFGDAAKLEERALRLEHISQNTKAMVYSLQNLGHIYLMLGNYYNASEQLSKALHLSEKNNLSAEQIHTLLLLAFLHTRQNNMNKANEYLKEAKQLVDLTEDEWEWVNYLFYSAYWHLENQNYTEADSLIDLFLRKTKNIYKYQCTGIYLKGLVLTRGKGLDDEAEKLLQQALKMTETLPMVFWRYQIAFSIAKLYEKKAEGVSTEKMLSISLESILKISKSLYDKILETQFWESNEITQVIDSIKRIPQLNLKLIQWQIEK